MSDENSAAELRAHALQYGRRAIDLMWEKIEEGDTELLKVFVTRVLPPVNVRDDRVSSKVFTGTGESTQERVQRLFDKYEQGEISFATLEGLVGVVMRFAEAKEVEDIKARLDEIHQLSGS